MSYQPCTRGSLSHRLYCGTVIRTTSPEACAGNCQEAFLNPHSHHSNMIDMSVIHFCACSFCNEPSETWLGTTGPDPFWSSAAVTAFQNPVAAQDFNFTGAQQQAIAPQFDNNDPNGWVTPITKQAEVSAAQPVATESPSLFQRLMDGVMSPFMTSREAATLFAPENDSNTAIPSRVDSLLVPGAPAMSSPGQSETLVEGESSGYVRVRDNVPAHMRNLPGLAKEVIYGPTQAQLDRAAASKKHPIPEGAKYACDLPNFKENSVIGAINSWMDME